MIPLSALSVVCKFLKDQDFGWDADSHDTVADSGLGKDMWTVSPEDITHILYVSQLTLPSNSSAD